jgi:hypothetical protein
MLPPPPAVLPPWNGRTFAEFVRCAAECVEGEAAGRHARGGDDAAGGVDGTGGEGAGE